VVNQRFEFPAPRTPLLIVGASARAAAFSAVRAGITPWTADLFADRDLVRVSIDCRRVADYPRGLLEIARQGPAGPWLYTGALENAPRLVQQLSRCRPLWGNPAAVLRRVRCPLTVARVLDEHGIACPKVLDGSDVPTPGRWLRKPKAGASGCGIDFADQRSAGSAASYLQEYLEGDAHSAVYVGTADRTTLLGVTRQLVGESWLHAGPFRYCGSIGPRTLSTALAGALDRLGQVLTTACELRGLFGVDFILRDDSPWPLEINPRYTASVEVLEWATGRAALSDCAGSSPRREVLGKAIYYAPSPLRLPVAGPWEDCLQRAFDPWHVPDYADIPLPGEPFDTGQPVLTFFAAAATVEECRGNLQRIAGDLDRRLFSR